MGTILYYTFVRLTALMESAPLRQYCSLKSRPREEYQFIVAKRATVVAGVRAITGDYILTALQRNSVPKQVWKPAQFFQTFKIIDKPTRGPKWPDAMETIPRSRGIPAGQKAMSPAEVRQECADTLDHWIDRLIQRSEAQARCIALGMSAQEFEREALQKLDKATKSFRDELYYGHIRPRDFELFASQMKRGLPPEGIYHIAHWFTGTRMGWKDIEGAIQAIGREYDDRVADKMGGVMAGYFDKMVKVTK